MGNFVMPGANETELMPKHFGRKPYGRNNGRFCVNVTQDM